MDFSSRRGHGNRALRCWRHSAKPAPRGEVLLQRALSERVGRIRVVCILFVQATGTPSEWSGVPEPVNAAATGKPSIVGRLSVGDTLTADTSGIADANGLERVRFRYQWISSDGTADTDIEGATSASYTLVSADEGSTIKVRVSFHR